MNGYLPEFLAQAERLGFRPAGHTGKGHPRLTNGNGDSVTVPLTPSDFRSQRNALARMERLAGEKLPRPNSGHYRHRRQPQLNTTLSPTEKQASERVDALVAEADSLRQRFAELTAQPTRDTALEARRVLARFGRLRQLLAQRHHIIAPIEGQENTP
jgi:hypothetical protein